MRYLLRALLISCAANLIACAGIPHTPPRPAISTRACMRATVDVHLPEGLPEKRAHCIAAGLIARYCSVSEAYLAGLGKELHDLIGPGDAQWADWRADREGIACAREAEDDAALARCCTERGY